MWGTVLEWEPPRLIRMTWHPGHAAENPSEVEVTFARVTETQTLVTIAHDGWERFADPQAARAEYGNGWPMVLADYARSVEPAGDPGDGPVWLVLTHTPAPGVGDPFQHPGFAGHLAFLESLRGRGMLVAAGPFPGSGEGMTVVRLDSPGDVAGIVAEARERDAGVVDGVLEVRVRPWAITPISPILELWLERRPTNRA